MLDVGLEQADRAADAGKGGHDDLGQPHLLGDPRRHERPPAPEGEQREPARIEPALDEGEADAHLHVHAHDAQQAERGLLDRDAERDRDLGLPP